MLDPVSIASAAAQTGAAWDKLKGYVDRGYSPWQQVSSGQLGEGWNKVSESQLKNYNAMVDWLNKQYSDDADLAKGTSTLETWFRKGHGADHNQHAAWSNYWIPSTSDNEILNSYVASGLGDFDTYRQQMQDQFLRDYENKSSEVSKNTINDILGTFNKDSILTDKDTAQYNDALAKLDAQKARGYLSDSGYAKALEQLNAERSINQSALNSAFNAQYNSWTDDLNQAFQKGLMSQEALNDEYAWTNRGSLNFTDALSGLNKVGDSIKSYGQGTLNSLFDASNQYTPDEYIATGAASQGQYNPFDTSMLTSTKKKKKPTGENVGEM